MLSVTAVAKLALLSDVHGDARALAQALEHARRLGCARVLCAGDLVSYGDDPGTAIALLREHRVECVRGNHDRWAARDGADLHGRALDAGIVAFLAARAPSLQTTAAGLRIAVCHARPDDDMRGFFDDTPARDIEEYLDGLEVDVLVTGHTHVPLVRPLSGGRLLVNPGAVLRDARAGAAVTVSGTFGVLDAAHRRFTAYRIGGEAVASAGEAPPRGLDGD